MIYWRQKQGCFFRNMFMKKCAELVDERALTQQKIDEQVKLTRKKLQRVLSILALNISLDYLTFFSEEITRYSCCFRRSVKYG